MKTSMAVTAGFALLTVLSPCFGAPQSGAPSKCPTTYEDNNQIDNKPLKLALIQGVTEIDVGSQRESVAPGACFALFTDEDHRLVTSFEADSEGHFELENVIPGSYRLVGYADGFCTANIRLELVKSLHSKPQIVVHFLTAGIDTCSYGELAPTAQNKSATGDFTRSPDENIINEVHEPFVVRSVAGTAVRKEGMREPLSGVLFEIQGPGTDKKIRHTTTDGQGRFRITRLSPGTYKFKATLRSFQSVVGTIEVSNSASKTSHVDIEMGTGV